MMYRGGLRAEVSSLFCSDVYSFVYTFLCIAHLCNEFHSYRVYMSIYINSLLIVPSAVQCPGPTVTYPLSIIAKSNVLIKKWIWERFLLTVTTLTQSRKYFNTNSHTALREPCPRRDTSWCGRWRRFPEPSHSTGLDEGHCLVGDSPLSSCFDSKGLLSANRSFPLDEFLDSSREALKRLTYIKP